MEKALEMVSSLPPEQQDAIASQILVDLADEDAWKRRFTQKRDLIRRLAQEALEEDQRGETLPLKLFRDLPRKCKKSRAERISAHKASPDELDSADGLIHQLVKLMVVGREYSGL